MSNIHPHCWQRIEGTTVDTRDFHNIGKEDFEFFDQIIQCAQSLLVRYGIHRPSDGAVEFTPFIFRARTILFCINMGERQYDWNLLVRRVFQNDHDRFLRYIRNMTRTNDVICLYYYNESLDRRYLHGISGHAQLDGDQLMLKSKLFVTVPPTDTGHVVVPVKDWEPYLNPTTGGALRLQQLWRRRQRQQRF